MKITSVRERALVRLIPCTYHKPPVLRGLVDSNDEAEVLAVFEGKTSARLQAQEHGTPSIDRRELVFQRRDHDLRLYGQAHINAAFVYTRTGGNRFNDESRGAWYCSFNELTSVSEVGFHRTRELANVGSYLDEARYVALLADFVGDFPDLVDNAEHPALQKDTSLGYPAGQQLALQLRREGHSGLLYPSVRHPGGRCFVAFSPQIIQNVRPGAQWCLRWIGGPDFEIRVL